MTNTRYEQFKAIFFEALEMSPDQREAYLAEVCSQDPELYREVVSLLESRAEDLTFLERPLTDIKSPQDLLPEDGRLGPYALERIIGRGGMGVVYLARRDDGAFDRQVAIKVLSGFFATVEGRRRFLRERHILANLDHPHIARLFEAGTTARGLPYFVMELVEGERIDTFCTNHALSLRDRLALFAKVCRAVQHAHQNLIVHRDLKPSNILVSADGAPKLLDFGIATSPHTEPFANAGPDGGPMTPEYASPEQFRGESITTASDVYSLGILLYELLTGRRPYDFTGIQSRAIDLAIAQTEPCKPSQAAAAQAAAAQAAAAQAALGKAAAGKPGRFKRRSPLQRALAGDLDQLVMTAMSKEPGRRYATAEQLAEDIDRYLKGYPLQARQESWLYPAAKFLRRHKRGVSVAALAVAATIGFFILLAVQKGQIERQRNSARAAAESALRERNIAQSVTDFMIGVFDRSNPYSGRGGGAEVNARDLLTQAVADIRADQVQDPQTKATLLENMGRAMTGLGLYTESEPLLAEALNTKIRVLGGRHAEVANGLLAQGELLLRQGRNDEALARFTRAQAIREAVFGPDQVNVAETLDASAAALIRMGRFDEAETCAGRALLIQEQALAGPHPDKARSLRLIGETHGRRGNFPLAEELMTKALVITEAVYGPEHSVAAELLNNLAVLAHLQQQWGKAEKLTLRVLAIQEPRLGEAHPVVAGLLSNLAIYSSELGKYAQAATIFGRVVALREKIFGPDHPEFGGSLQNFAMLHLKNGNIMEAEALLTRALGILEKKPESGYLGNVLTTFGILKAQQRRFQDAVTYFERAVAAIETRTGSEDPELLETIAGLSKTYIELGQWDRAVSASQRALELARKTLGPGHPSTAECIALNEMIKKRIAAVKATRNDALLAAAQGVADPEKHLPKK